MLAPRMKCGEMRNKMSGRRKIYESVAERVRCWRARQKQKAAPSTTPEILLPTTPETDLGTQTLAPPILLTALGGLVRPGSAAVVPPAHPLPVEPNPTPEPSAAWVPDWKQENRVDLPMRTPEEIARLLKFETVEQTAARIQNDKIRYMRSRR
jgi:hypothetical protein